MTTLIIIALIAAAFAYTLLVADDAKTIALRSSNTRMQAHEQACEHIIRQSLRYRFSPLALPYLLMLRRQARTLRANRQSLAQ